MTFAITCFVVVVLLWVGLEKLVNLVGGIIVWVSGDNEHVVMVVTIASYAIILGVPIVLVHNLVS